MGKTSSGEDAGGVLHAGRHFAQVVQGVAESHFKLRELLQEVAPEVLVGHAYAAVQLNP